MNPESIGEKAKLYFEEPFAISIPLDPTSLFADLGSKVFKKWIGN